MNGLSEEIEFLRDIGRVIEIQSAAMGKRLRDVVRDDDDVPFSARICSGNFDGDLADYPNVIERTPPYIEDLVPDSPGAKAGLKPDDLVSFVDGEPIYSIKAFQEYIKKTKPGMTLRLEVRRGDNLQTVELKLSEIPK